MQDIKIDIYLFFLSEAFFSLLNQKLKLLYININYLIRNNILFNYLEHWLRNAKHAFELPAGLDMFFIYLIEQYHYVDFSFQLDMNTRSSVKYYKLNMPWYTFSIALLTKTVFCFILCYLRTIFFKNCFVNFMFIITIYFHFISLYCVCFLVTKSKLQIYLM